MIKTEALQALKAIHKMGNFSKAALELRITQSALSKRIQGLEQQLSTRLLSRSTRSVEFTLAGQELLGLARQFEKLTSEYFDGNGKNASDCLSGIVRIGASSSHLRPFVLPALAPLARRQPNVHFEIVHGSIQNIEAQLLELKVDFALTDRKAKSTKKIEYLKVGEERYVVIRPLVEGNAERFLGTVPSDPTFQEFMAKQETSLQPKSPEMTFLGDVPAIIDAVALGFGSSIVPEHMIGAQHSQLRIDERYRPITHPFFLAYLQQPYLSVLEKQIIAAFDPKSA